MSTLVFLNSYLLFLSLVFSHLISTTSSFPSPSLATAPIITTDCGPVSGTIDTARLSNQTVYRYSSIPYAAPPIGPLRFRSPAPRTCPWTGTLNGSVVPEVCVQDQGRKGIEDCLYLHVVVPTTACSVLRPVLVYFHGGNLISGGTPGMIAPSAVIATQLDAVVVAVAYRLNVIGWLADDSFEEEEGFAGNYGVMDAIASLQWVQANIEAFGGDKSSVTLFGQSSGGTLIFALYAAPSASGLFTGAFSMSGSPNITKNAVEKRLQDAPIVEALGCGGRIVGPARLACLRSLPAANLSAAMPNSWNTPGIFGWLSSGLPPPLSGGMNYAGIVHVDGKVLTLSFADSLANQTVNASLLISNMEAECDGGPALVVRNFTQSQWNQTVLSAFSSWPGGGEFEAKTLLSAYAEMSAIDPQLAYDAISADYGLTCAGRKLAKQLQKPLSNNRTREIYLLFNAMPRSQWSPNGASRWPSHELDLQELGWSWSFEPTSVDLAEADIMHHLLKDYAVGRGTMPEDWDWPPVAGPGAPADSIQTMVLALSNVYPGGGVRVEKEWRKEQCDGALELIGMGENYWWCD